MRLLFTSALHFMVVGVVIFYEFPPHFPRVSLDVGERSVRPIIDLVSRASDHFIQFHFRALQMEDYDGLICQDEKNTLT